MRVAYICLLVFAILVGVFIGYYIWGPTWVLPGELQYKVLKDVLTITLAVIAVGVAVLSYLFYKLALGFFETRAQKIVKEMTQQTTNASHRVAARSSTSIGYAYWLDSEKSLKRAAIERSRQKREFAESEARQYLNRAIDLTKQAYDWHASKLDERDIENQRLICAIRNNLAYYLAERNEGEDMKLARNYAEYIRSKIRDFPLQRDEWLDTYDFVLKQEALRVERGEEHNQELDIP